MAERVMNGNAIQKVRIREVDRVITIEPLERKDHHCPLLGAAAGSKLTVERFLEMTREDKEDAAW
jgi:virulence-associated protein VagC